MRHRIGCAVNIGIGRSVGSAFNLDNNYERLTKEQEKLVSEICKEFLINFASWYYEGIEKECSADFGYDEEGYFYIGWEPSYQYDPLNMLCFDLNDKGKSFRVYGTSFGPYGTQIASKFRYYKDYKRKNKYLKFVDKYFDKLKEAFLA